MALSTNLFLMWKEKKDKEEIWHFSQEETRTMLSDKQVTRSSINDALEIDEDGSHMVFRADNTGDTQIFQPFVKETIERLGIKETPNTSTCYTLFNG